MSEKEVAQAEPFPGFYRLREAYARDQITYLELEVAINRGLRGLPLEAPPPPVIEPPAPPPPKPVIAPPPHDLPPAPPPIPDEYAALRARLLDDVRKYQQENQQ